MTETASNALLVRTFLTHQMSDAEISALSTARVDEFEQILNTVRRSRKASPGRTQNVVIYGARGFGKSFMTRRVEIAVNDTKAKPPTVFLLLPEEQHNLYQSPHAFLEEMARRLENLRRGEDLAFEEGHFVWPDRDNADRLWSAATDRLEAALDAALPRGRGLVVIAVENFDTLLSTLFKRDEAEQRLRRWLERDGARTMLLATATGTVDMDYDRPLFQAFAPVRLSRWSSDDCIAYFNRQRDYVGQPPLAPDQEAKARAVADFIGGNPRLAQLLAEVLETQDALTVAETMNALADKLAEYYRRRIEDLSELSRGLLDALIRGGEPASQTELARRVRAEGQSRIARVMQDLQRSDLIRGHRSHDSREILYSVVDRVFVHYYRLRQGSRAAQDSPLATILDFLRSFYTTEEKRDQALAFLNRGLREEARIFNRLADEATPSTVTGHYGYFSKFARRLQTAMSIAPIVFDHDSAELMAMVETDAGRAYRLAKTTKPKSDVAAATLAMIKAAALCNLDQVSRAEKTLRDSLSASQSDKNARVIASFELVFFVHYVLGRESEARRISQELQSVRGPFASPMVACIHARQVAWGFWLNDPLRSLKWANRALRIANDVADPLERSAALRIKSSALQSLGRFEEAVETNTLAARQAASAGDEGEEATSLRQKAFCLGILRHHKEAVETATLAAQRAKSAGDAKVEAESLRHKAFSLGSLGRDVDAVATFLDAMERAEEGGDETEAALATFQMIQLSQARLPDAFPTLFDKACTAWKYRDRYPDAKAVNMVPSFLVAAALARQGSAATTVLRRHMPLFASEEATPRFYPNHGYVLAEHAAETSRAEGFRAMSEFLNAVAKFEEELPEQQRAKGWLAEVAIGFAWACQNSGLLRDIASILNDEISDSAREIAELFFRLADYDAAEEPDAVLARTDPDVATLIRRLRNLIDTDSATLRTRKGRGRR